MPREGLGLDPWAPQSEETTTRRPYKVCVVVDTDFDKLRRCPGVPSSSGGHSMIRTASPKARRSIDDVPMCRSNFAGNTATHSSLDR